MATYHCIRFATKPGQPLRLLSHIDCVRNMPVPARGRRPAIAVPLETAETIVRNFIARGFRAEVVR